MFLKSDRIGEVNENKYGSEMQIEEYHGALDVWVRFDTGNLEHTTYYNFINGKVRSLYDSTVCEVGYIGKGKYKPSENGKATKAYSTWAAMLNRAYSEKYHSRNPSYKGVTVCKEWWNFQVFAEWFENNYYQIENEEMSMDKDILVKGNKLYSPDTCVFVPHRINVLFIARTRARGKLPVGVAFNKVAKRYQSQCANANSEIVPLGHYDTPEEAFLAYKIHKERVIKDVADEYKDKIPSRLYNALINWMIEIDD
ncbi:hypothetical protein [Neobacillus mesonae]|uniref:hypothetical protein n=1 Tax=Neobacillus mesonae TaxID=1193713 RepID=UPI002573AA55|nr:hypothetical protein [Neobacillus mesonae]